MLTADSPVVTSMVPLPSVANELTTQVDGKPLTGTGGPKKQVGSKAQAPRAPAQSASLVQATCGLLTQCWVGCGPVVQSARLVPRLATSVVPSGELKIEVAFSGMSDGGSLELPPPMYRQPSPSCRIGIVPSVSSPEKGPSPTSGLNSFGCWQSEPGVVVKLRCVPSGGEVVEVDVVVVVVVVLVVGTVKARDSVCAKKSIWVSIGLS